MRLSCLPWIPRMTAGAAITKKKHQAGLIHLAGNKRIRIKQPRYFKAKGLGRFRREASNSGREAYKGTAYPSRIRTDQVLEGKRLYKHRQKASQYLILLRLSSLFLRTVCSPKTAYTLQQCNFRWISTERAAGKCGLFQVSYDARRGNCTL